MLPEKQTTKLSKLLSLVLRHQPEYLGIELDGNGWTNVNTLIDKIKVKDKDFDLITLQYIVDTNAKKRFAFNDGLDKIRASQGHSISIDLDVKPQTPPDVLYHGTAVQNLSSIREKGLLKQNRNHVHLSKDIATALAVGARHGKPVLVTIKSLEMHNNGFVFIISQNGVWLTDNVPAKYISIE